MKKTLKLAVAASVLATPAMAVNMENPLFLPAQGTAFSKTSVGLMIKKADSSDAHVAKGHDGEIEFPIYRIHQDIGYGITDRLAVHGSFGYTHDGDVDRKGLHLGRIGATYRVFENHDDFVWDLYADAHMGGTSKMAGEFTTTGFNYDNYTNGRWGFHAGTKIGKTWSRFTGAMFAEVLQTFGSANNEIRVGIPPLVMGGIPETISVDLKSTLEYNAGVKGFYEVDDRWAIGGGLTYKHHADNGVKSLATDISGAAPLAAGTVNGIMAGLSNMDDGFDEYIISFSVANQITDATQVVLYGEYTFDTAHAQSQNGTDLKAEVGVRLNVAF